MSDRLLLEDSSGVLLLEDGSELLLTYADNVLADNPKSYYRFGDAETLGGHGDTAVDETGYANGTYNNFVTMEQPGALYEDPDWSVVFDGTSYLEVGDYLYDFSTNTFSLEIWLKTATANQRIVSWGNQTPELRINASGYFTGNSRDWLELARSSVRVDDDAWHHCVWTKNSTTSLIYVDGEDVTVGITDYTFGDASGGFWWLGTGGRDEGAIYENVLSPARVLAHYEAGQAALATAVRRGFIKRPIVYDNA
jgi:hypothetical protein